MLVTNASDAGRVSIDLQPLRELGVHPPLVLQGLLAAVAPELSNIEFLLLGQQSYVLAGGDLAADLDRPLDLIWVELQDYPLPFEVRVLVLRGRCRSGKGSRR
jgi:hypothetical protein